MLAAALAARTSRIRLNAGSVVLPLHHSVRVAEEWSVVDNISGGRAGLCVASGWHATDFALAPHHFGRHREVMYEQLKVVP
nr:LLM class flavin-dependent oxidoreductase [Streptomyces antimycoticus]